MKEKVRSLKEGLIPGLAHRILWPEAESFRDLFYDVREVENLGPYRSTDSHAFSLREVRGQRRRAGRAAVSSFCPVESGGRRTRYLDLKPHGRTIELIEENMILLPGYKISFKVNVWSGGLALVSADYDKILGSRWFALVDASTVP